MFHRSPCVADASIWIDLAAGGIVAPVFALPFRWLTPDAVFAELLNPWAAGLPALGLAVVELSGDDLLAVARLRARYRAVSVPDCAALALAASLGATLITGDDALRRAARAESVEVHGTLWVLDELVALGLVAARPAAVALTAMREAGRRLPAAEVERRLTQWRI